MSGPEVIRRQATPAGPYARQYVDATGLAWRVRELSVSDRSPALYFESVIGFRRVTRYPADWRELPTGELEILSLRT